MTKRGLRFPKLVQEDGAGPQITKLQPESKNKYGKKCKKVFKKQKKTFKKVLPGGGDLTSQGAGLAS